MLYYLTDNLGVAAGIAGLIVAGPKIWDVFIAPVLGALSDKTALRSGTRRPWLLLGALTLPLLFVAMFSVPESMVGTVAAALWVAVAFTIAITAFATFQVSYLTMPAEITDSYTERTQVMAWRIVFLTLSILLFGAGAPLLVTAGGDGLAGYRLMAAVLAVLLFLAMMAAWWFTRGTRMWTSEVSEPTMSERIRAIRENRDFTILLGAFVLQALAVGCMLASAPYVAEYILGDAALTTILFVCLVAPAVLVMPLWSKVAKKYGKERGFLWASLLVLVAVLGLTALRFLPELGVYLLVALVGIGYAGIQMFPLAMLPDTLAADAAVHGKQRAGLFTGIWTAGETGGLAIGPGLVGFSLAVFGFISTTAGETVVQPDSALLGIVVAFSVVPAGLMMLSLPLVRRYSLTEARLNDLVAKSAT